MYVYVCTSTLCNTYVTGFEKSFLPWIKFNSISLHKTIATLKTYS